jgi:DNA-binding Lrp family transcriptional regulator
MRQTWETFRVSGDELIKRVKELLHEGNVRRVVVKQGARTVVEFPVTVGVVGAIAAPALAALGAIAALLSECTIEVERETAEPTASKTRSAPPSPRRRPARPRRK